MTKEVKQFDPTKMTEASIEKAAIEEDRRLQEYNDRVANNQLTDQEKKAINNNRKLADLFEKMGSNAKLEDVKKIFEK